MDYLFGAYRLDTQRYELTHAGVPIPLRPKVFQVLAYLLAHHDRVVSKEELLEQLWPGQFVGDVGLNSYMMAVRKALGDRPPALSVCSHRARAWLSLCRGSDGSRSDATRSSGAVGAGQGSYTIAGRRATRARRAAGAGRRPGG
jgi:hypothetical protein